MPSHWRAALARFGELFRRRSRSAAERDEELSFHLEMETAENIRRGMSEAEARRAALLRFGGTQRYREEMSDARGIVALDNLARDTRFALRRLKRAPGFAAGVIATLGIGIGAAVGIGSMVYGVLLRDLPYDEPDQLVRVGFITDGMGTSGDLHSAATYFHLAKGTRSLSAIGTYSVSDDYALIDGDSPEGVTAASVTPSTLTLLGVRPLLGQLFEPGDTSWSNPRQAILISENLWRRRYGADPAIIGRRLEIDHGERFVIGVLPRSFDFPASGIDLYYPSPTPVSRPDILYRSAHAVGRLRDGVTRAAAEAELNSLVPGLSERFPAITPDLLQKSRARVAVTPLKAATVAAVRPQLILLAVLVAVVLLIATTNTVNLFLLRTERASQEIAVALSLGATRMSLAQRFIMEGIVVGLASSVVAFPVAALAVSTKFGFTEREIPRLHEIAFTWETAALVLAGTVLIGAATGLIGLTRAGAAGLFDRLRASRSTSSRAWRRAQDVLVASQVAVALVLLVAAGLLGRSFWNLSNARIGFESGNAMTFHVSLPYGRTGYTTYTEQATFHAGVLDRLAALPGVAAVGVASRLPLTSRGAPLLDLQLRAVGERDRPPAQAAGNLAGPDYFDAMRIPLIAGRAFQSGDLHGAPAVVVSDALAMSLFGTTDVIGRPIVRPARPEAPPATFTIVGVAGSVHWERIEDGYVPMAYFPLLRDGDGLPADSRPVPYRPRDVQFVIRGPQLPTASTIQGIMQGLDYRVPAKDIRTLDSVVSDATARVRLVMLLIAIAGASALLLGVIGVYSVVAYAANGRMREFGIRLALGAAPVRVSGMVVGDGLRLIAVGTVSGLVVALGATRFLRALLYEVEPVSVTEFALATVLLVALALGATLLPARRAARTHPSVVLRGE